MKLAFVDATGFAGAFDQIRKIAEACELQLARDVPLFWQTAPIPIAAYAALSDVPGGYDIVAFLADADMANAAGYHTRTPDGRPYARVFTRATLESGLGWHGPGGVGTTASHEAVEMHANPSASLWAETARGHLRAVELADLVEADSYDVGNGVHVSNFLGARAFEIGSSGPYDFMRSLTDPEADPREGNYEIRWWPGSNPIAVYGANYPEWKKENKTHLASRTQRRMRGRTLGG